MSAATVAAAVNAAAANAAAADVRSGTTRLFTFYRSTPVCSQHVNGHLE